MSVQLHNVIIGLCTHHGFPRQGAGLELCWLFRGSPHYYPFRVACCLRRSSRRVSDEHDFPDSPASGNVIDGLRFFFNSILHYVSVAGGSELLFCLYSVTLSVTMIIEAVRFQGDIPISAAAAA